MNLIIHIRRLSEDRWEPVCVAKEPEAFIFVEEFKREGYAVALVRERKETNSRTV